MQPKRIWIVVTDGGMCRFLASEKRNADPAIAMPDLNMPNPPTREQGTDKPGRTFESVGNRRSAYEPPADWHEQAKRDFAREIAGLLKEKSRNGDFDKLILVAPPEMLGNLRPLLSPETKEKLLGEVNKDYTQLTPREIKEQLSESYNV
ncbi:host attachment protein [Parvibaculum sp.]|jgi:protein required for attachment to host cells|uniref:host attachment protein n=1 Tax=Parvibaculum sp. TaxID=2024848 RepID=UPI000C5FF5D1|nr:host attachment protein [Parvibaculum sp.]HAC58905.1 host attachment protein [Rhodobiaceae bacterium]MAU60575.1 host cell attachment protein [Parvibaculum sp.]MBO6667453.1 host attachment protein [Parvibaculum sp.]MBO6692763.1 host attachment protein [Parvibaculum sp.]MBO6714005.1 host attachment protein [Parvibaculum sp.]|tara:strand:+ start:7723 stop:8169 length:447 start_codon:yes stop_codon:yes gene_type:complete